jgi:uncharacterized membrane protein
MRQRVSQIGNLDLVFGGGHKRALKVVLVIVGLLFLASVYPLLRMQLGPSEQMLGGVYATLGIFLLLALRNTSANRSLVAFTAWSLIHATIMAVQAFHNVIPREDLLRAVLPLVIVGVALIVLAPAEAGVARS